MINAGKEQSSSRDESTFKAPSFTNPNLGAKLRADCEALKNDVFQSRELAADFQRQLSGKSNEFAALKRVFDEARFHLAKLERDIQELREERHRLANQAMRAVALERMLVERDGQIAQLKREIADFAASVKPSAAISARRGVAAFFPWKPKS